MISIPRICEYVTLLCEKLLLLLLMFHVFPLQMLMLTNSVSLELKLERC